MDEFAHLAVRLSPLPFQLFHSRSTTSLSPSISFTDFCEGYLRTLDRNRLTADIQHMLTKDSNLRASAAQYYLANDGAGGGSRAVASRQASHAKENNGGFMSDFSDSEDDFD